MAYLYRLVLPFLIAATVIGTGGTASAATPTPVVMCNFASNGWTADNAQINGNSAQADRTFTCPTKSVVIVTASGVTQGANSQPTGMVLYIERNGVPVSSDESYEANPGGVMSFRSSASYAFPLNANTQTTITARVAPYGPGSATNRDTSVHLQVIVLQAGW